MVFEGITESQAMEVGVVDGDAVASALLAQPVVDALGTALR